MIYSVCMSVYGKDNPDDFLLAIRSVYYQTIPPSEIVLVVDGPIPSSLNDAIDSLLTEISALKVIRLADNKGHAVARQTALEAATNNLCAIMDSDDISVPNRFEIQLEAFEKNPDVSVVGGHIYEFINKPENVVGRRLVPERDADIKRFMKSRCPMNLVTVMFKKDDILAVGGYKDWYCEEDYYLWIRLALGGYKFYNIQENLVNVRVGDEMYRRRGGIQYFRSEAKLQKFMLKNRIIGSSRFLVNVFMRLVLQVLMPNRMRGWAFRTLARS